MCFSMFLNSSTTGLVELASSRHLYNVKNTNITEELASDRNSDQKVDNSNEQND